MPFYDETGLGTRNFAGPRTAREGTTGNVRTSGIVKEKTVFTSAINISDEIAGEEIFIDTLPVGAKLFKAVFDVNEAFVLGGTTPTIRVNDKGTVANNVELAEASAEAKGVYEVTTFGGAWATEIATAATVVVTLGGTTPTITAAGFAKITLFYYLSSNV